MCPQHDDSDDEVRRRLEEASKGVERFLTPWPESESIPTRFSDFPIGVDDEGRPFERTRQAADEEERKEKDRGAEH